MKISSLKNKIVLFLLCAVLSLSVQALAEQTPSDYALNSKLHGFTLIEERTLVSPPALLRLWQHDKTGAQVYFFHNDDPDRTFSVAFRTEPSDDTGKLHILEHAVCSASENYPGQDVFFDAIAQAYITDMNASTYKSATNYYVGSMSEDQLEQMADFYLDCAFNSLLRSEPNYFYREGWRYSMADMDAPLTVDGIVYNEMKGLLDNIYSMHYSLGLPRALFPDTYQRWESGGDPAVIPELTYEELIAFYDKCYHPSNSISMFYGDVETERYLRLLNEKHFSKFEAQTSAGYAPGQAPFAGMITYEQDFPVSAQSEQTGGIISYAAVLPEGMAFSEILALLMGLHCLSDESSPLIEALYATGIGSDYWTEYTSIGTQFVLLISADEADTTRAQEFKAVVDESLSSIIKEGFDLEMIESLFAKQALNSALVSDQKGIGVMMAERIAQMIDSGYTELLDENAYLQEAQILCTEGRLESLMQTHFLDNPHAALIITAPKSGLLEERENAQAQALAAKKASMSQQELEQIISHTASFRKWIDEGASNPETLKKLRTVTPDSVNTALPVYKTEITEIDGARLYTADVDGDAVYCKYIFDVSHLTVEELRTLDVYLKLMGSSTEQRSQRDISIALQSLLTGLYTSVTVQTRIDGSVYPALTVSFYALDSHLEAAASLIMEMLCSTDIAANAYYFDTAIATLSQSYYIAENVAESIAVAAALAKSSASSALEYTLFGMDYYAYLTQLEAMEDDELIKRFAAVREKALVREGTTVIAVGNAAGRQTRSEALCALLPAASQLQETGDWADAMKQDFPSAIGFKASGTSSYAAAALDLSSLNLVSTGELYLLTDIISDAFLLPELRFQLGAYGAAMSLKTTGIYNFKLFRAPSFAEALDRLSTLAEDMQQLLSEMTADELTGYQLSRISEMTQPYGPWSEAAQQIEYLRKGIDPQQHQMIVDQVRDATPETLSAALPQLQQIIDAAAFAVVAPGSAIDTSTELFDQIILLP